MITLKRSHRPKSRRHLPVPFCLCHRIFLSRLGGEHGFTQRENYYFY